MTEPAPAVQLSLAAQFRKFLVETNAMALAMAVVLGAAVTKMVNALVEGFIMPIVALVLPVGNWRNWRIILERGGTGPDGTVTEDTAIMIGNILAASLDFIIVAAVVFFIGAKLLKLEIKR